MRIGITGGIGTGKTTVCKYLHSLGYKVLSADETAHQLMRQGEVNYQKIKEHFGEGILESNGEISREKLGTIVFKDAKKRKELEALTHENILKTMFEESSGAGLFFLEIPLLYEAGLENRLDDVWLIDCSLEEQLRRVSKREDLDNKKSKEKLKAQMPREAKLAKASSVIVNDGDLCKLEEQVQRLLTELRNMGEK